MTVLFSWCLVTSTLLASTSMAFLVVSRRPRRIPTFQKYFSQRGHASSSTRTFTTTDSDTNNWNDDTTNDNNNDAYWLRQIQKQGEARKEYQWFRQMSSLPFECTGCGKCCKTKGNVYMTPEEHQQAADLLDMSKQEFIQHYASHTLLEDSTTKPGEEEEEERMWIRLRDHSTTSTTSTNKDHQHGCIFLQDDNTCRIYDARPIQCSTYPFWPNILASQQAWNDEVRRPDDDNDDNHDDNHQKIPLWTKEQGGCEGMKLVVTDDDDDDDKLDDADDQSSVSVPREQVYEQAFWYEHDDRRFPRGKEIRVKPTS